MVGAHSSHAYRTAFLERRRVMTAARNLNAYHFALFVGNVLHKGLDYRGTPKGAIAESLLAGTYNGTWPSIHPDIIVELAANTPTSKTM